MERSDLHELHFITAIPNVPSILERGILSNRLARDLPHTSVAAPEIQERRDPRVVPGGRLLHEYANLYVHARNPMMYRRKEMHATLCVLRVSTDVLDLPQAVIADGNASSDYTGFWPSPAGLSRLAKELVFAEYWTDNDQIAMYHKRRVRCAEVLVPQKVDPRFIFGAYVSCKEALSALETVGPHLSATVDPHLFFQ